VWLLLKHKLAFRRSGTWLSDFGKLGGIGALLPHPDGGFLLGEEGTIKALQWEREAKTPKYLIK
jgi:hypothetical protein